MSESNQHQQMKKQVIKYFRKLGYKAVKEKSYRPDVLLTKDGNRIGVECETHKNLQKIRKLKYGNAFRYVDKVIVVYPKIDIEKLKFLTKNSKIEIIKLPFSKEVKLKPIKKIKFKKVEKVEIKDDIKVAAYNYGLRRLKEIERNCLRPGRS